ncbi:FolC bifunctional protein [Rhodotorula sp. JG-1b]|nr:FolC bifunctional protein [Rhodotorula sp. JG-1b]
MPPPATGISLGLARIHRLLAALRSPHHATPIVHIAGTNGKGSVSAYLSSILQHGGGIATARFNSPHLVDEWDCIHLHGRPVDEATFRAAKHRVQLASERENVDATSFEVLTATAFTLFATATPPVDLAVVEVGMGGAQDATNVVPASRTLLSVITALDLDHQKFLGDTVGDIARVKAGIIRDEGDVVVSVQAHEEAREAIVQVAHERHARPTSCSSTGHFEPASSSHTLHARLPLPGSYQLENAATAVLCASLLRSLPRTRRLVPALGSGSSSTLTDAAIRTGVEATRWPGRLSWLSDPDLDPDSNRLLLDGAHNPSSATLLASYLSSLPPHLLPSTLIFALSAPRDPSDVVRPLLQALLGVGGGVEAATTDTEKRKRRRRHVLRVVCCGFSTPVGMEWVRPTLPSELADRVRYEVNELLLSQQEPEQGDVEVQVLEAGDAEEALRIAEAAEEEVEDQDEIEVKAEDQDGVTTTRRTPPPPIVVAGSLYLVADVMRLARRLGAGAGAGAGVYGQEDA